MHYGTAEECGYSGYGTVFRVDTSGNEMIHLGLLGEVRMKIPFHAGSEERDGCMIGAVFEAKRRFQTIHALRRERSVAHVKIKFQNHSLDWDHAGTTDLIFLISCDCVFYPNLST